MADLDYSMVNSTMSRVATLLEMLNGRLATQGTAGGLQSPQLAQGSVWHPGVQTASMFGEIPGAIAGMMQPFLGSSMPMAKGPNFSQLQYNQFAGFMNASAAARSENDSNMLGKVLPGAWTKAGSTLLQAAGMMMPEVRQIQDALGGALFQKSYFNSASQQAILNAEFNKNHNWASAGQAALATQARLRGSSVGSASENAMGYALSSATGMSEDSAVRFVSGANRSFGARGDDILAMTFAARRAGISNPTGQLANMWARAANTGMDATQIFGMGQNIAQAAGMGLWQGMSVAAGSGAAAEHLRSRGHSVDQEMNNNLIAGTVNNVVAGAGSREASVLAAMAASGDPNVGAVKAAMARGDRRAVDRLIGQFSRTKGVGLIGHVSLHSVQKSIGTDGADIVGGYVSGRQLDRVSKGLSSAIHRMSDADLASFANGELDGLAGKYGIRSGAALAAMPGAAVAELAARGVKGSAKTLKAETERAGKLLSGDASAVTDSWEEIAGTFAKVFAAQGGLSGVMAALKSLLMLGGQPATATVAPTFKDGF